jgi:hypothetical protein
LREGRPGDSLGDTLDFQIIPNEFDDDRNGWAELLVHSTDGVSNRFALELYTDLGLVPTKAAFERKIGGARVGRRRALERMRAVWRPASAVRS